MADSGNPIVSWLLGEFSHPLSLVLIFLGACLIWVGLGGELPFVSGGRDLNPIQVNFSLGAGSVLIVIAIVVFYIPRPGRSTAHAAAAAESTNLSVGLPPELGRPFLVRVGLLSSTQRDVLQYIEDSAPVKDSDLQSETGLPSAELHYRLEQLRLLGMIDVKVGPNGSRYDLTPGYAEARTDPQLRGQRTVHMDRTSSGR